VLLRHGGSFGGRLVWHVLSHEIRPDSRMRLVTLRGHGSALLERIALGFSRVWQALRVFSAQTKAGVDELMAGSRRLVQGWHMIAAAHIVGNETSILKSDCCHTVLYMDSCDWNQGCHPDSQHLMELLSSFSALWCNLKNSVAEGARYSIGKCPVTSGL
jgi:hypothetical protein